jgi:hypothetical protein
MYKLRLFIINIKRKITSAFVSEKRIVSRITPHAGSSSFFGKNEIIQLISSSMADTRIRILDVGPGRGIYNNLLKLKGYRNIDAVEIYKPYINKFRLTEIYETVYNKNIVGFQYDPYDVIIFGDVLEHIRVKDAKRVLDYAKAHAALIVVSVPYLDNQIGQQLDGSGDHQQNDLTRAVFLDRYKGFKLLIDCDKVGVFYYLCV